MWGEYVGSHKHWCDGCKKEYVCSEDLECELGYNAPCESCYVAGLIAREDEIAREHAEQEGEQKSGTESARQTESVRAARVGSSETRSARDRWAH